MYLKSPRRRREQILNVKCNETFFSAPKIGLPEARNKYIVKCIEKYVSVPKIDSPEARTKFYVEIVESHAAKNPGS